MTSYAIILFPKVKENKGAKYAICDLFDDRFLKRKRF